MDLTKHFFCHQHGQQLQRRTHQILILLFDYSFTKSVSAGWDDFSVFVCLILMLYFVLFCEWLCCNQWGVYLCILYLHVTAIQFEVFSIFMFTLQYIVFIKTFCKVIFESIKRFLCTQHGLIYKK